MGAVHLPIRERNAPQPLAPRVGARRQVDLTLDQVDDGIEHLGFVRDVVVEGHRFDPECLREAAHREGFQAFGIGELDRGGEHPLARERFASHRVGSWRIGHPGVAPWALTSLTA
jgi:hypothetical protein